MYVSFAFALVSTKYWQHKRNLWQHKEKRGLYLHGDNRLVHFELRQRSLQICAFLGRVLVAFRLSHLHMPIKYNNFICMDAHMHTHTHTHVCAGVCMITQFLKNNEAVSTLFFITANVLNYDKNIDMHMTFFTHFHISVTAIEIHHFSNDQADYISHSIWHEWMKHFI